jgi:hypothetical protein
MNGRQIVDEVPAVSLSSKALEAQERMAPDSDRKQTLCRLIGENRQIAHRLDCGTSGAPRASNVRLRGTKERLASVERDYFRLAFAAATRRPRASLFNR